MPKRWLIGTAAVALGLAYGLVSGVLNRNPHYEPGAPPPTTTPNFAAWAWEPSRAWLPGYLVCVVPRNGYGITRTRSGYLFRTNGDRARYTAASTLIGGLMGCLVAAPFVIAPVMRRWATRCDYDTTGLSGACPECGLPHSGHGAPSTNPARE